MIFFRVKKSVFVEHILQGDDLFNLLMPANPTRPGQKAKTSSSQARGARLRSPPFFLSMAAAAKIMLRDFAYI
jgi:hypothetical protein